MTATPSKRREPSNPGLWGGPDSNQGPGIVLITLGLAPHLRRAELEDCPPSDSPLSKP